MAIGGQFFDGCFFDLPPDFCQGCLRANRVGFLRRIQFFTVQTQAAVAAHADTQFFQGIKRAKVCHDRSAQVPACPAGVVGC